MESDLLQIYVDLDALLDTRITTIVQNWPEAGIALVADDAYYLREVDEFPEHGITKEMFRAAYDRRDLSMLRGALPTPIAIQLHEHITQLEIQNSSSPMAGKPVVYLNVWPYKLSPELRIAYTNAVMCYCGVETLVKIIDIPPHAITMMDARERYAAFFMYDFALWARMHMREMERTIAPRTTFYAPTIYLERAPTADDMAAFGLRRDVNPTLLTEMGMAEKLALDMMPTYFFCPMRPDKALEWRAMFYEARQPPQANHPASQEEDARLKELEEQAAQAEREKQK